MHFYPPCRHRQIGHEYHIARNAVESLSSSPARCSHTHTHTHTSKRFNNIFTAASIFSSFAHLWPVGQRGGAGGRRLLAASRPARGLTFKRSRHLATTTTTTATSRERSNGAPSSSGWQQAVEVEGQSRLAATEVTTVGLDLSLSGLKIYGARARRVQESALECTSHVVRAPAHAYDLLLLYDCDECVRIMFLS